MARPFSGASQLSSPRYITRIPLLQLIAHIADILCVVSPTEGRVVILHAPGRCLSLLAEGSAPPSIPPSNTKSQYH